MEEKIRNAYVFEIDKRYIESLIYQLYYSLGENELNQYLFQEIDVELTELFTRLRASSKMKFVRLMIQLILTKNVIV